MAGFFGRMRELEVVRAALARAPGEHRPSVVVVDGEPGVGKSRLIDEASRNADRVAVFAYEPEMNLPFSLGHDLTRALARSSQAAEQILDPMLSPEPGGPRPDWTSIFEAAHRAAGVRDSLLVTIDDFQWSDERSTALVHYLVRGALADGDPLALVVGGRRSISVSALVTSLDRLLGDQLTRVTLGPLDHHSTVELARAVNPALDPQAAAAVADRSGGSPFWCELLAEDRDVDADVARIVADRLAASRNTDAAVLFETIAVLGRQAPVDDLIAIRGWPEDRLMAARAELMATALVVEEGGALRIVHDLVRAAAVTQLPDERQRDIHARVASWLEGAAGENVTLLLKASEAKDRAGLDHLPLTLRIVRSPMRRLVGLDGLRSIVALIDSVPAGTPHERELQCELASLAAELGQQGLAMERWARIADRLDTPRDRARAWLGASDAAQQLERVDDARVHLERARGAGSDDPVLLLELQAADAAITRWLEHRPQEAGSMTNAALERARLATSTRPMEAFEPRFQNAYQRTLVLACVDAMQANEPELVLPLVEEMTRVAAGGGIEASLQASLRRGSALTHLGRLAEAEEWLGAAWLEARRAFLSGIALDIGSWLVQTSYMRGRLIEAQEVADECEALAERIGEPSRPAMLARMWRLIATISNGDHRAALADIAALCEVEGDPHHRIPLHQAIARWHSRLDGAASADEVLVRIAAGRRDMAEARCTRCGLEFTRAATESLARVGAVAEAVQWFEEAERTPPRGDLQVWERQRARSALAAAGRGDRGSLQEAVDGADALGMPIESIWARTSMARGKAAEGDRAEAEKTLWEAAAVAEETGAATERAHIDQLLRQLGIRTWRRGARTRTSGDLSSLSEREREIANLIAGGASNPDIAGTLFLSRKTVERHVSNILAKLEVKNRAQVAARMAAGDGRASTDRQG
jgi:DNA-binding CsgD family transcriptional regulator